MGWRSATPGWRRILADGALAISLTCTPLAHGDYTPAEKLGEELYRFYCYQCHGYSGDGNTTAAAFLTDPPANFHLAMSRGVTRDSMIESVAAGRKGTPMTAFSAVLSRNEIVAIVDYIRGPLTTAIDSDPSPGYYHDRNNGWVNSNGNESGLVLAGGVLVSNGSGTSRIRNEFKDACSTCHEFAPPLESESADAMPWELYSVSYPPGNYLEIHVGPGETEQVFEQHETLKTDHLSDAQLITGAHHYAENCAHCHAEDVSGRNWIGSFLSPRPMDLKRSAFLQRQQSRVLTDVIRAGVPGTSMPAFGGVLDDGTIASITAYLLTLTQADGKQEAAMMAHQVTAPRWVATKSCCDSNQIRINVSAAPMNRTE